MTLKEYRSQLVEVYASIPEKVRATFEGKDLLQGALDAVAREYCAGLAVNGGRGDVSSFSEGSKPWYDVAMKDGRVFRGVAVQGSGGVFRNDSGDRVLHRLRDYRAKGSETNLIIGVDRWFGNQAFPVRIDDVVAVVAAEEEAV